MSNNEDATHGGGTTRRKWKETVSGEAIIAWCGECGDPMLLSGTWKQSVQTYSPECPDCDPDDWIDHADVKVHPKDAEALIEYDE